MKKAIKMSAMMLALFAAVLMVSCGAKTSSPDVKAVADVLNTVAGEVKNAETPDGAMKILSEMAKLDNYTNSSVVLTGDDASALVDALSNLAEKSGESVSSSEKADAVKDITGASLGDFVTMVQNEFIGGMQSAF